MHFYLAAVFSALSAATLGYAVTLSGDVTWYDTGLGACGHANTDADFIVAVDHTTFDTWPGATANPNNNPLCGRTMRVDAGGRSVTVVITDKCMGCAPGSVDLSPTAFLQLAPLGVGRIHGAVSTVL
ncbi:RlpA-like double-psi beta-barrel-protein domain-containing protein-containing protein [Daedaleopsis nitida]|nr:RlpA-like double-psi beta-barrel-protein domain-containing protein-containing protein [Daedaleopsis nitida]KAI0742262.1 RlpA-like double-psi beta-barrel-protein domain-containing protein-containing protein [Daedaleopsis nitida]